MWKFLRESNLIHKTREKNSQFSNPDYRFGCDISSEQLFKTTYLDSWGSGVQRMIDACTEAKVPLPRYELRPGGVAIIFDRPKKRVAGCDITKNVIENVLDNLTERQRLIVKRLIETGAMDVLENVLENVLETNATLAAYFHVNDRTIRRDIAKLQSSGIIKHEGPDKGGKWIVLMNRIAGIDQQGEY